MQDQFQAALDLIQTIKDQAKKRQVAYERRSRSPSPLEPKSYQDLSETQQKHIANIANAHPGKLSIAAFILSSGAGSYLTISPPKNPFLNDGQIYEQYLGAALLVIAGLMLLNAVYNEYKAYKSKEALMHPADGSKSINKENIKDCVREYRQVAKEVVGKDKEQAVHEVWSP
jgi:hypothetical protein